MYAVFVYHREIQTFTRKVTQISNGEVHFQEIHSFNFVPEIYIWQYSLQI
jgi:hypothetical protein